MLVDKQVAAYMTQLLLDGDDFIPLAEQKS